MKRVLCVWLPHWPLQHWGETHPELKTETLAVALYEEASRGALRIVECSAAAWARRIRPGMSLAEATALANPPADKNRSLSSAASTSAGQRVRDDSSHAGPPALHSASDLHLERYDPIAARAALVELAGWCEQFSPSVGLEEAERPESLLLDVTGLGHLFGGEENLCAQVAEAFAGRGLQIRLALADTIAAAWALAHFAKASCASGASQVPGVPQAPVVLVAPGEAVEAVSQLPIAALRLTAEPARLLVELGLVQVGQLQAISRAALGTRFGAELLRRWDQLTGETDEVIHAEEPPAELQAIWSSEHPVARNDVIEAVVERLLTQVAEALALQGRGVVRLTCRLRGVGQQHRVGSVSGQFLLALFRPSATGRHLFELARLQLERLRLAEPVTEIVVSVTASDLLECRQGELFAEEGGREDRRQLAGLIDRLASRLGRERVLRARRTHDAQPELACRYEPLTGASARRAPRNRTAARGKEQSWRGRERPLQATRREESSKTNPAWPQAKRPRRKTQRAAEDFVEDDRAGRGFQWSERPLRLAPQPAPLEVIALVPDGPPLRFCLCGQTHLIARVWGPERIETGWWRGRPVRRDYYRVETDAGLRHWLFRRLADGHWFWHGEFD